MVSIEDDFIRICISKKHSIRKFIFENINVNWMSSEIHRKLYEYLSIDTNAIINLENKLHSININLKFEILNDLNIEYRISNV